jgi:release factor glutamine methyltransferase
VLDVGTGSGAIAVTLAAELDRPVWACDISIAALTIAERNRSRHQAPVWFFAGDLVEAVAPASVDLLLSNPPYVPGVDAANMQTEVRDWEPHVALFAGDTGLEIYKRLITGARTVLKPGGRLLMELGYQSLEGVRALLIDGWRDFEVISDLAGWPRVIGCSV